MSSFPELFKICVNIDWCELKFVDELNVLLVFILLNVEFTFKPGGSEPHWILSRFLLPSCRVFMILGRFSCICVKRKDTSLWLFIKNLWGCRLKQKEYFWFSWFYWLYFLVKLIEFCCFEERQWKIVCSSPVFIHPHRGPISQHWFPPHFCFWVSGWFELRLTHKCDVKHFYLWWQSVPFTKDRLIVAQKMNFLLMSLLINRFCSSLVK